MLCDIVPHHSICSSSSYLKLVRGWIPNRQSHWDTKTLFIHFYSVFKKIFYWCVIIIPLNHNQHKLILLLHNPFVREMLSKGLLYSQQYEILCSEDHTTLYTLISAVSSVLCVLNLKIHSYGQQDSRANHSYR